MKMLIGFDSIWIEPKILLKKRYTKYVIGVKSKVKEKFVKEIDFVLVVL
jgi:hypothetical protein